MDDSALIKKRLADLAKKSFGCNCYTFTDFLGLQELAAYYETEKEIRYASPAIFGGYTSAERAVIRFGNPEDLGYEEPYPIVLLKISPAQEKFADELTHRDFLGALMNLGVERSVIGDIIVTGRSAYVFCLDRISGFICSELCTVKHTTVHTEITGFDELPDSGAGQCCLKKLQVQSERTDAVTAHLMNLSRSAVLEYFRQGRIFVNGRMTDNAGYLLKKGDKVTVRGFGRYTFMGTESVSRKGKLNVTVEMAR